MKLLAITHNGADPTPYLAEEKRRFDELVQSGLIESAYLKADMSGAVLILEADSADDAHRDLSTLPLVTNGITRVELVELIAVP